MKWILIILFLPVFTYSQVFVSYSYGVKEEECPIIGTPCGGESEIEYEGIDYQIIEISNRCWFAENLNIGVRINGSVTQTDNSTIEKYCYNDNEDSCTVYGGLYQWDEAMQYVKTDSAQGICPSGWHVASYNEYTTLGVCIGGMDNAGGKLKEVGFTHWTTPNTGAINSYGFTALAGGLYTYSFLYVREKITMWTSTEAATLATIMIIDHNASKLDDGNWAKTIGGSVRCIKDL